VAESEIPVLARVSLGRWVGICPTDMNAMYLEDGQTRFECGSPTGYGSDGTTADVVWPADPATVLLSLQGRPVEEQNWNPEDV
jgi:hypothetical protein